MRARAVRPHPLSGAWWGCRFLPRRLDVPTSQPQSCEASRRLAKCFAHASRGCAFMAMERASTLLTSHRGATRRKSDRPKCDMTRAMAPTLPAPPGRTRKTAKSAFTSRETGSSMRRNHHIAKTGIRWLTHPGATFIMPPRRGLHSFPPHSTKRPGLHKRTGADAEIHTGAVSSAPFWRNMDAL